MASYVRKFIIKCNFNGQDSQFYIYVGAPKRNFHPIHHQNSWLIKERGYYLPDRVKEGLKKLYELSQKSGVSFVELCLYAINVVNNRKGLFNKK